MHKIKDFIKDFWPSMLTLAVILYATLAKNPVGADELPPIPHIDKLIHAVMIGGMFSAVAFDMSRKNKHKLSNKTLWTIFACVCAFGLADEGFQAIPAIGRGCDPADFAADCAGALIALWLAPKAIAKVLRLNR